MLSAVMKRRIVAVIAIAVVAPPAMLVACLRFAIDALDDAIVGLMEAITRWFDRYLPWPADVEAESE